MLAIDLDLCANFEFIFILRFVNYIMKI